MYKVTINNKSWIERPLYNIFFHNKNWYIIVPKVNKCKGCCFYHSTCCRSSFFNWYTYGRCGETTRSDKIGIIFKIINMENNQIIIDIPKGMKIDITNSDLSKGIIKFIKKPIEFIEVLDALKNYSTYINTLKLTENTYESNYMTAVARLKDIATYYNKNWTYIQKDRDTTGYYIVYDGSTENKFQVRLIHSSSCVYSGQVMFKNEEDAQSVIDNPNFRGILNTIYRL